MNNLIQFNTGRHYTEEGQRVVVEVVDSHTVKFHDIDRMIYGTLQQFPVHVHQDIPVAMARAVMQRYDAMQYGNDLTHQTAPQWDDDLELIKYY